MEELVDPVRVYLMHAIKTAIIENRSDNELCDVLRSRLSHPTDLAHKIIEAWTKETWEVYSVRRHLVTRNRQGRPMHRCTERPEKPAPLNQRSLNQLRSVWGPGNFAKMLPDS